jgi:Tol biopolymer transport system component
VDANGISASGRYVGLEGIGAGLPGANGQEQVWVRDRKAGRTKLVSRANDGAPGDLGSSDPALSATGRFVVFRSSASNLPGAAPGESRVYVRDLKRRRTVLVSKANDGTAVSGSLYGQTISADGRRVTFYSADKDLPGGNGVDSHVYVRYRKRGRTILADRTSGGLVADADGGNSSISGNGRFVIFESGATNLPSAGASSNQVYVRDLKRQKTRLAGRNSAGEPQDGYAEFAHLSGSGRYAQFVSPGSNLPGGDGSTPQVYIRDMRRGKTRLASKASNGAPADAEATDATISLDGRWVVFESYADNLGGNTAVQQVFRAGPFG